MSRIVFTPQEARPYRKSRQATRLRLKRIGIFFAVVIIIAMLMYVLRLPHWRIQNIQIVGLGELEEQTVQSRVQSLLSGSLLAIIPKNSFFIARTSMVRQLLAKEFPQFESISVASVFPQTLKINVVERNVWAIACNLLAPAALATPPRCVFLDRQGFAYENAPFSQGPLLLRIETDADSAIGTYALDAELISEMHVVEEKLKTFGTDAVEFGYISKIPGEFAVATSAGYKLLLRRGDNVDAVFKILKTVLEKEIGDKAVNLNYIDLRFGNKVFYKYK